MLEVNVFFNFACIVGKHFIYFQSGNVFFKTRMSGSFMRPNVITK